jgi:hypothetical protein
MDIRVLGGVGMTEVNRLEGLPAGVYHRMFSTLEEATELAKKTGMDLVYSAPHLGVYFVEVKE